MQVVYNHDSIGPATSPMRVKPNRVVVASISIFEYVRLVIREIVSIRLFPTAGSITVALAAVLVFDQAKIGLVLVVVAIFKAESDALLFVPSERCRSSVGIRIFGERTVRTQGRMVSL